jgi:superfamily II RNA helicase
MDSTLILSDFQKHAIHGIMTGHSVMITAPTGSGKTLPALFAIDWLTQSGGRIIYTTPIKALSNQKKYEISSKFPHLTVGIYTGDIKVNPQAQVLVMTTEILMNYLHQFQNTTTMTPRQFDFTLDDVKCVVFDEIHYINDEERGHVWEQTLMMLPTGIQKIMLSATIANPETFCRWLESMGGPEIWLCPTTHRVVPLTHYSYVTVQQGFIKTIKDESLKRELQTMTQELTMIQNQSGGFNETAYFKIKQKLNLLNTKHTAPISRKFVLNSLLTLLHQRQQLPALIFVLSRKQVEAVAKEITCCVVPDGCRSSQSDSLVCAANSRSSQSAVVATGHSPSVVADAVCAANEGVAQRLSAPPSLVGHSLTPREISRFCEHWLREKLTNFREYLDLPEYQTLVSLMEKGIGYHHSGMIPILRELVELCISNKMIYVLVATESFAIGLDCPIKTTIFPSFTKFDGTVNRKLLPHEYAQMSGRAGRRGLDTEGLVIHCNNLCPLPLLQEYKLLLCGTPLPLKSQFKFSFPWLFSILVNKPQGIHVNELEQIANQSMLGNQTRLSLEMKKKQLEQLVSLNAVAATPEYVLRYVDLQKQCEFASKKKMKDLDKQMKEIISANPDLFRDDLAMYQHRLREEKANTVMKQEITHLEQSVSNHLQTILDKLRFENFIHVVASGDDRQIQLTRRGNLASYFSEIHPLVGCQLIEDSRWYSATPSEIAGLLSCFVDVLPAVLGEEADNKKKSVMTDLEVVYLSLHECMDKWDNWNYENQMNCNTSSNVISNTWFRCIVRWCECTDEVECKTLIATVCAANEEGAALRQPTASIGDFIKGILKINAIVQELKQAFEKSVEIQERIPMLHKLSQIEVLLLKYIALPQSLYV